MSADIKQLFEAGAHFGHNGIHVINLEITVEQLDKASDFAKEVASRGRQILFVGTQKQAKDVVKAAAESVNMPYVTERWMGGMLTNQQTIVSQIKKLKLLEKRMASGELASRYSKLEVQRYQEEIDGLNNRYGGIKELRGKPGAVIVMSAVADKNAVAEARKLNIPVIAICDTNADPTGVDYVIPANDDAIATMQLIINQLVDSIKAGSVVAAKRAEERKAANKTETDKEA